MKDLINKISIRQMYIVFFIGVCSSLIRILPTQLKMVTDGTVWISPIINFGLFTLLVFMINSIFKNKPDSSLAEIMDEVFGNIVSKILLSIYVIYFILQASIYLRYFGERLVSTLYGYVNITFFMSILLIFIFFIVKNSIENLARFVEVFFYIFITMIILIAILAIPDIKLTNFSIPNLSNIANSFKTIPIISGIFSYITFTMFLGKSISRKEEIKKYGIRVAVLFLLFSLIIIFVTIGSFGHSLSQHLSLPFFSEIKNISIFKTIERVESVFITMWVVTDVAIISMFIYISSTVCAHIVKAKNIKYISTPIIFLIYILAISVANSVFELDKFSETIMPIFNFSLGFILPILLLAIGKLRKKI